MGVGLFYPPIQAEGSAGVKLRENEQTFIVSRSPQPIQASFTPFAVDAFYRCPTNSEKNYA
jgi:hypothetical protein